AFLLLAGSVAISSNLPDGVIRVPLPRIMNQSFYGMEFEVGNPPQRSWLKIDTGSPTIGFISPRSNLCLRADAPCEALGTYDNLTSSTAAVAFPDGSYPNYSDGLLDSGRGILINDTVRFSGVTVDDFILGSTDSFNLDVKLTQVNPFAGIMGLSAICFDPSCAVYLTLVQQLADRGIIKTRAFSIYLAEDKPDAVGHFLIGGVDEAKREGPVFTQKLDTPWGMEYSSFTLNKSGEKTVWPIGPGNETDWDTGASYWGLPTDVFNAVAAELGLPEDISTTENPYEVDCKYRDLADSVLEVGFILPMLVPLFSTGFPNNGTIKIPVGRLVTKLDSGKCVTFALNGVGGPGYAPVATVFGQPFLRSIYATYNLDTLEVSYSQVKYTDEERIVAI
ncbi:acid protease, partial [Trichoderma citrinoviride]